MSKEICILGERKEKKNLMTIVDEHKAAQSEKEKIQQVLVDRNRSEIKSFENDV